MNKNSKIKLRLSVFRSTKHIFAQIIDDKTGGTLVAASDMELKMKEKLGKAEARKGTGTEKRSKTAKASLVGELLAQKALKLGIDRVVFDRGHLKYHGRVRALAEGARKGGLKF